MTHAQKTELHNLDHKWRKHGLNKAELKRRDALKKKEENEVRALATKLAGKWCFKHDFEVNRDKQRTVYINNV